jgi:tetratricopeptide (TPR) repeat protein
MSQNTSKLPSHQARTLFEQAYELDMQGEFPQAIALYTQAIALDADFAEAYNNRGLAYEAMGEYARALDDYEKALTLSPHDAQAYENRGTLRMETAIIRAQRKILAS